MSATPIDLIAERELRYTDDSGTEHALLVQVARPEPDSDGTWTCRYRIGAPLDDESIAYGEDSLQALLMALQVVGIKLRHSAAPLRDRLTWLGTTDLGLP